MSAEEKNGLTDAEVDQLPEDELNALLDWHLEQCDKEPGAPKTPQKESTTPPPEPGAPMKRKRSLSLETQSGREGYSKIRRTRSAPVHAGAEKNANQDIRSDPKYQEWLASEPAQAMLEDDSYDSDFDRFCIVHNL